MHISQRHQPPQGSHGDQRLTFAGLREKGEDLCVVGEGCPGEVVVGNKREESWASFGCQARTPKPPFSMTPESASRRIHERLCACARPQRCAFASWRALRAGSRTGPAGLRSQSRPERDRCADPPTSTTARVRNELELVSSPRRSP